MLELLGESAIRAIILAALVWALVLLFARRNPQIQLLVLRWILIGAVVMPALVIWSPIEFPIPVPAEIIDPYRASIEIEESTPITPSQIMAVDRKATIETLSTPAQRSTARIWSLYDLAISFYFIVVALLLMRQITGLAYAWKLISRSASVEGPGDVRVTALISAPATIGSTIILPEDSAAWPSPTMNSVLAHERTHVANGDFYILLLAGLYRAVFWFSPLSWWLHARIAATAEIVCDEAASETIGERQGYAEILVTLASGDTPPGLALSIARASTIEMRVKRLLSESANTLNLPQPIRNLLALAVLFGVTSLAWTTARSTTSDEFSLTKFNVLSDVPPVEYFVANLRRLSAIDPMKWQAVQFVARPVLITALEPTELRSERIIKPLLAPSHLELAIAPLREAEAGVPVVQRIAVNNSVADGEFALHHQLGAMIAGHPDYDRMTEAAAESFRAQYPKIRRTQPALGRIETVTFDSVNAAGEAVFNVVYQSGTAVWIVAPLTADGKITALRCAEIVEAIPVYDHIITLFGGPSATDMGPAKLR